MSLVSSAIPNLVNGVSQQPYVQRLISQGELQLNGHSSLVEGLRKRPPSVHIAKVLSSPLANAYVHTINRSLTEQYIVILDGSTLHVFDMSGNPRTVSFPNGTGYITDGNPRQDFTITTVADYSFVVNKTVTVAQASSTTGSRPFEAIVWIREGSYDMNYTVTVAGRTVTLHTADSSESFNGAFIDTTYICNAIYSMLTGSWAGSGATSESHSVSGTLAAGTTITNIGSSLYVSSSTDYAVASSDGNGGNNIVVSKGVVQTFANLPAVCVPGVVMEIAGVGNDGTNSNYWVTYQNNVSNTNVGVWVECPAPSEANGLDPTTMPHQLIRNGDGTFTFQQSTWATRQAGSLAICPLPSFVGNTINDTFWYQDRLGFLSNENVVMSQTGSPFNFMRQTALQLLDDDMIDIGSTSTQASVLKAAVVSQGTLFLFSDLVQFALTYQNLLSPNTVSINTVANFTVNLSAKPIGVGANVFFAFSRGSWVGVREYYLDGAGRISQANEVTSHVPKYIPGTPFRISAASHEDLLTVISDGDLTSLWVYRYYWSQGQKLQSSWSQWQFQPTDTILNAEFLQDFLYLVISRPDGVYLESMDVQPEIYETGQNFAVHLDRRVWSQFQGGAALSAWNSTTGITTITLPYAPADWTKIVCVSWGGVGDAWDLGFIVPITPTGATTFTVPGKMSLFIVGTTYTFRYRFSTFLTREPVPMTYTMQAVTEGRLQIRNTLVNYANSGYFRAEVTAFGRPMNSYTFTPGCLGGAANTAGSVWTSTGTFKFPVQTKNTYATIDLVNDTFLPCFFESAGWEGFFVLRSRRV